MLLCLWTGKESSKRPLRHVKQTFKNNWQHCSHYWRTLIIDYFLHLLLASAENGHLELLKWCRSNQCPWHWETCRYAAACGHLEVLKWCRVNGCQWDEKVCTAASKNGHLELLKWARLNGCPWDKITYENRVENRNPALVRYLEDEGCPRPIYVSDHS